MNKQFAVQGSDRILLAEAWAVKNTLSKTTWSFPVPDLYSPGEVHVCAWGLLMGPAHGLQQKIEPAEDPREWIVRSP